MICNPCNSTCDVCPRAKRYRMADALFAGGLLNAYGTPDEDNDAKRYRLRPSGPYHLSEDGKRTKCGVTIGRVFHIGGDKMSAHWICKSCLRVDKGGD